MQQYADNWSMVGGSLGYKPLLVGGAQERNCQFLSSFCDDFDQKASE